MAFYISVGSEIRSYEVFLGCIRIRDLLSLWDAKLRMEFDLPLLINKGLALFELLLA